MKDNPFQEHIAEYINLWKCVRQDQLQTQRFVEKNYYQKEVCGTFQECVDKLVESGTIRRVKFEARGKEIVFLMANDAKFLGWC